MIGYHQKIRNYIIRLHGIEDLIKIVLTVLDINLQRLRN
jgi:hypothetical protein